MSRYYTYLIASLPMLHFGARPPFSFEKFINLCNGFIDDEELQALKNAPKIEGYTYKGNGSSALKAWQEFDTTLRNELVRIRAVRRRVEPLKYLRPQTASYIESYATQAVHGASRSPSAIEAERILDMARWQKLEELAVGHYFDMDFLLIYAEKLLILKRWERIRNAEGDKERLLAETLEAK